MQKYSREDIAKVCMYYWSSVLIMLIGHSSVWHRLVLQFFHSVALDGTINCGGFSVVKHKLSQYYNLGHLTAKRNLFSAYNDDINFMFSLLQVSCLVVVLCVACVQEVTISTMRYYNWMQKYGKRDILVAV